MSPIQSGLLLAFIAAASMALSPAALANDHEDGAKTHATSMWASVDSNADGLISADEHAAAAAARFAKADSNGDGQLSQDEVQSSRKAMHGEHPRMKGMDHGAMKNGMEHEKHEAMEKAAEATGDGMN